MIKFLAELSGLVEVSIVRVFFIVLQICSGLWLCIKVGLVWGGEEGVSVFDSFLRYISTAHWR